ncbi:MAG: RsmD family RNA methyltransferase [Saprospiraceae bacterium]|jgi:16S rRNA (guanine(966)-N(2))-methyltransferase RsmD|nr:RsmD family RNA methyltransferase [Saprospiraceae bacterium]MBL0026023.1 RsmD family RNA methyltransferase [Saprospiraceae bacterium]
MRIISGKFKGRKFIPPARNWPTRPTTDFAKEGLFNILNNRINFEETVMLDLFGGTGNHSYEFLSRGCKDVTYVDSFRGCVTFVLKTTEELGMHDHIQIIKSDVFRFLKTNIRQFDYIFAGPPYPLPNLNSIPDEIFNSNAIQENGLFVLEHNPNHNFKDHSRYFEERNYGTTIFSFFK